MKSNSAFMTLGMVATLSLTGCVASSLPGEEEEDLGSVQQATEEENGLDVNGMSNNGLSNNGLSNNGLSNNGLSNNGLSNNGLVMSALTDPVARKLLKYIVGCALAPGQRVDLNVDGTNYRYDGNLGLAPSWGLNGGSCDPTCQAWVSGCVLARVNYLGETVPISVRGSANSLASDSFERSTYPNREATYYGDIFSLPQKRFACKSPGSSLISRVCGPSTTGCIMNVVGDCDQKCDAVTTADGAFTNCKDDQGTPYLGSVTIYRQ